MIAVDTHPLRCFSDSKMLIVGDFCPFTGADNVELTIHDDLRVLFKETILVVNLECPITDHNVMIPKSGPNIRAKPEVSKLMKDLDIAICNLANNHILDYGTKGLIDTCKILDNNDIIHFGIKGDFSNESITIEIGEKRIGLVSFTENEFSTRGETNKALGLNCSIQFKHINNLRNQVDYIIVQYHGGVEHYQYPTPKQQEYAKFLIDIGADAVVCHHSHCISGYQEYKQKPIFYGLGNFYFPEIGNKETWYRGLGVVLDFSEQLTYQVVGFEHDQKSNHLYKLNDMDIFRLTDELNKIIVSANDVENQWSSYCKKNALRTLKAIVPSNLFERLLIKAGLDNQLYKKISYGYFNVLRCESHKERILTTLSQILYGDKE